MDLFITDFWDMAGYQKNDFTQAEKEEFIRAYAAPGAATCSANWYSAFTQDAEDNTAFGRTQLSMPVLDMGSDHTTGVFLAAHCRLVATHVQEIIIRDSGHWIVQEQTEQVKQALLDFFIH
jgi:pimeloyl-ACP methyl ester carboxylesterase